MWDAGNSGILMLMISLFLCAPWSVFSKAYFMMLECYIIKGKKSRIHKIERVLPE